jgi:hypothetical protein
MHDKNWAWNNYLSLRALQQADSIRTQLKRIMERYDIESVTISDEKKLFSNIRQALVCGFFMQVAHKEGEKGNYLTVKDNQVSRTCQCLSVYLPTLSHSIDLPGRGSAPVMRSRHPARMGPVQRIRSDHQAVHPHRIGDQSRMVRPPFSSIFFHADGVSAIGSSNMPRTTSTSRPSPMEKRSVRCSARGTREWARSTVQGLPNRNHPRRRGSRSSRTGETPRSGRSDNEDSK